MEEIKTYGTAHFEGGTPEDHEKMRRLHDRALRDSIRKTVTRKLLKIPEPPPPRRLRMGIPLKPPRLTEVALAVRWVLFSSRF